MLNSKITLAKGTVIRIRDSVILKDLQKFSVWILTEARRQSVGKIQVNKRITECATNLEEKRRVLKRGVVLKWVNTDAKTMTKYEIYHINSTKYANLMRSYDTFDINEWDEKRTQICRTLRDGSRQLHRVITWHDVSGNKL
jgi:hypothetical protein